MSAPIVVNYRSLDFLGFPGYRVGDDGSVWSCRKNNFHPAGIWHQLTLIKGTKRGYMQVKLSNRRKQKTIGVHRLVLLAFVGPCSEGMEARHFPDPDRANNRLENLSWGTRSENGEDKRLHGTAPRGMRHPFAKLTDDDVREIRSLHASEGLSMRAIGRKFGLSHVTVGLIIRRKMWGHVA